MATIEELERRIEELESWAFRLPNILKLVDNISRTQEEQLRQAGELRTLVTKLVIGKDNFMSQ